MLSDYVTPNIIQRCPITIVASSTKYLMNCGHFQGITPYPNQITMQDEFLVGFSIRLDVLHGFDTVFFTNESKIV